MSKIKVIDLFAGCGGLLDGFMRSGLYDPVASVEWQKHQVNTLRNRLSSKWHVKDAQETVLHFDIQREDLFTGWSNDPDYQDSVGLDEIVSNKGGVDIIIGGPPCQAYSVAGRVRDKDNMKSDYRNYLFEHYLEVVNRYKPKLFVFENVPGMLSAMPDGTPIPDLIRRDADKIGYKIVEDIKGLAQIDISDYGIPQTRKRVILIGLNKDFYPDYKDVLDKFYTEILPGYKANKKVSVGEAIGDLEVIKPLGEINSKGKISHINPNSEISWHVPRYHNSKDIEVFRRLALDIESGENKLTNAAELNKIYEQVTGKKTSVHKYHVLRKDLPSTTILAHLYKDGLRFIHYDSKQARSITVREAARLQSFDDDFEFIGPQGAAYQMIGNAVPPKFAEVLAKSVKKILK
ncbi:DNA cytosine methyltransferase [Clostridium paraputrificum]|uniref:DNA cytosine methyltransferase n=1 Tax=Clostridium paraputrificum TaxID=29363 RepID=UPI0006C023FA|nr:DNA cytosine methyltransferase [Clostridium paraputrificum]CUO39887.1 DNA-cytosine methyltransferase [Clostridium paraputrificum]